MTSFPDSRLRRLRGSDPMRNMARETRLSVKEFIYPLFVAHGNGVKEAIEPMPGQFQMSLDVLSCSLQYAVSTSIE